MRHQFSTPVIALVFWAAALLLPQSLQAQAVSALGEWYDQNKLTDNLGDRRGWWYYVDLDESAVTNADGSYWYPWELGGALSKHIADEGYTNGPPYDPTPDQLPGAPAPTNWSWRDEFGNLWRWSSDGSCWAGAADNLQRYARGGSSRYQAWIYSNDYPDGWTHTWQLGNGPDRPLKSDGYNIRSTNSVAGEWEADPSYTLRDWLADGLPVSPGVTDHTNGGFGDSSHLITCYGIDPVARRITIACTDTDYQSPGLAPGFATYDYSFGTYTDATLAVHERVFHIHDYGNGLARLNSFVGFDSSDWTGSGMDGNTNMSGPDCDWLTTANWASGYKPGVSNHSLIVKAKFENDGRLMVTNSDAQAHRLILRGWQTALEVTDTGYLDVGGLFVQDGSVTVLGALRANRVDLDYGHIEFSGEDCDIGRLDAPNRGDIVIANGVKLCASNANSAVGDGATRMGGYSELTIQDPGSHLLFNGNMEFSGQFAVEPSASLCVTGRLSFGLDHLPTSARFVGAAADIDGDLCLQRGTLAATQSTVWVDHWIKIGATSGVSEVNVAGSTLRANYIYLGAATGSHSHVYLTPYGGDDPHLYVHDYDGCVQVGRYGTAELFQDGGTVADEDGGSVPTLLVGLFAGATGTYVLVSGEVRPQHLRLGYAGNGTFTQSGGVAQVNTELLFGSQATGRGTYNLNGGTLTVNRIRREVAGDGAMNLNGGTLNLTALTNSYFALNIGAAAGSVVTQSFAGHSITASTVCAGYDGHGWLNLTDSRLVVTGELVAGRSNYGKIEQSGGSTTAGCVRIAVNSEANNSRFVLDSGTLTVTEGLHVGGEGYGSFLQDMGNTMVAVGALYVGEDSDSIFNEYEQRGGLLQVADCLQLGTGYDSRGRFVLDSAAVDATARCARVDVGMAGIGTFEQQAGTLVVTGELRVALNSAGSGTYTLMGGQVDSRLTRVGIGGHGVFNHFGGTHIARKLDIGSAGSGTYKLQGGTLVSSNQYVSCYWGAWFLQSGGQNATTNLYLGMGDSCSGVYTQSCGLNSIVASAFVGYGDGCTGLYHLVGSSPDGTLCSVGSNLYLGYGIGSHGVAVVEGGGFYQGELRVGGTLEVGGYGTGILQMAGGTLTGSGSVHVAEMGTLTGYGEVHLPVVNEGTLSVPGATLSFYQPLNSAAGATVQIGNGAMLQLYDGGSFEGAITNDGVLNPITTGSVSLAGAVTGNGALNVGVPLTAKANIQQSSICADFGSVFMQKEGCNATVDQFTVGGYSGRGDYILDNGASLNAKNGTVSGTFTQDGGLHNIGTLRIGNPSFFSFLPAQYTLNNGTCEVARLEIGNQEIMPMPSCTLSISGAYARLCVSSSLCFGARAVLDAAPDREISLTNASVEIRGTDSEALADLANVTLHWQGGGGPPCSLEAAARRGGGFVTNFAIGKLYVEKGVSLQFVDAYDNGRRGSTETVFLHDCDIGSDAELDLNGCGLYVEHDVAALLDGWIADGRLTDSSMLPDEYLDAVYVPANDWTVVNVELCDTDADGLPDRWENLYYGGATNAVPDADSDGDGMTSWEEYVAGTCPTNAASVLAITNVLHDTGTGNWIVRWQVGSESDRLYSVAWNTNLVNNYQFFVDGTNLPYPTSVYTDAIHSAAERLFYRVQVTKP